MKYKIINTTDRKNLGLIIENNVESYLLKNDYLFILKRLFIYTQ